MGLLENFDLGLEKETLGEISFQVVVPWHRLFQPEKGSSATLFWKKKKQKQESAWGQMSTGKNQIEEIQQLAESLN